LSIEGQEAMAKSLGCDSLRYLPIDSIARAVNLPSESLCRACITGHYPTPYGEKLYSIALDNHRSGRTDHRTYDLAAVR
jgi:amidophosphoribosyltransferase